MKTWLKNYNLHAGVVIVVGDEKVLDVLGVPTLIQKPLQDL